MPLSAGRGVLLALLAAGCGGAGPAPAVAPAAGWERGITPFAVVDADGAPLDLPFLGGFDHPRPQLVDIDADGQMDLFVQEMTGRLIHLEPTGSRRGLPVWTLRALAFQDIDIGEWYRFADLDGDGDFDLLAERPFSYISWWRNDGTPAQPRFVLGTDTLRAVDGAPLFSDRQNIPQLGDIDCDGTPDLLIGKLDGTVSRYEAIPGPAGAAPRFALLDERFQDIQIIGQQQPGAPGMRGGGEAGGSPTRHGANTMAIADHDGDGDPDLFWGDFFEPGLLLIENTGSCAAPNFRNREVRFPPGDPVETSGYNAPAFGDLDGDGAMDLVLGVLGGAFNANQTTIDNLYLLARDRGIETAERGPWEVKTRRLVPMIDVGNESIPALVDLDGDGDLDLLVANKIDPAALGTSRIYRFENTGSARAPRFAARGPLPFEGRYHYAPAFGDLDGDGRLDLILGQWGMGVAHYRGTPEGFALVDSAVVTITRGSNTTPTLGDLDGDGDLDLVIGEASGALNYYRNDGGATTPRFTLVSDTWLDLDTGRRSAPHLADLDGDGLLDLVIGSELEGTWILWNRGSAGTPRFVRDTTVTLPLAAMTAPAAGDLTGDGRPELVLGTVGGGLLYFSHR